MVAGPAPARAGTASSTRAVCRSRVSRGSQTAKDEPGFLTGAAGAAHALTDHGDLPARDVPARWNSLLLLS
jgi:hypothetical protein